jgi:magnesium-protoporphyrin O-methyltransferase
MSCGCSGFCAAVAHQFDSAVAEGDLARYRRKGPNPTTRLLRREILDAAAGQTLLDIGSGIGALSFELLGAGFTHSVAVDASSAYLETARHEAKARGLEQRLTLVHGDFVAAADTIPPADVVAMDRVVCCYPSFVPLLEHALARSRRAFALSYPRDRWYVRAVFRLENLARALFGNAFRTFVHPAATMAQLIESQGFRRVSRTGTFGWAVDVYVRDGA